MGRMLVYGMERLGIIFESLHVYEGLLHWLSNRESAYSARNEFYPWVRKIPSEGNGSPL